MIQNIWCINRIFLGQEESCENFEDVYVSADTKEEAIRLAEKFHADDLFHFHLHLRYSGILINSKVGELQLEGDVEGDVEGDGG